MNWRFLSRRVVEAIHIEQLQRHGGAQGLRDENALESALARAQNKQVYGQPDHAEIAAAYVFVDGNKRTAIVTAVTFLLVNGYALTADDGLLYSFTMGIASGEIDEAGATAFFRDHTVAIEEV
ncbi:type II toxin-antitoxin system death-on-curing family toxin [Brucella intermedia]|uniref:Cytochrome C biogenesis protein CcmH n=1 Tax=Brucella intermedia 229E TaxID=1337887 RepID=U4VBG9_9HYPH|nr:type II toxin-antitoxin system death-on-curing family toxin [Brucella intermedia]ERM00046.1 cytochrome C biogenesis protein CcmH [Brucella intermedia 229E]OAE41207.1 death-on-curing family protein [Brucella intermedia]OOC52005.1 cytochrome C biogenesis protein CcmH [Brucella intermedia M86]